MGVRLDGLRSHHGYTGRLRGVAPAALSGGESPGGAGGASRRRRGGDVSYVMRAPGGPAPSALTGGRTRWYAVGALGVAAAAFDVVIFGGIGKHAEFYWGSSPSRPAGGAAVG